jgi:hypothetical protein
MSSITKGSLVKAINDMPAIKQTEIHTVRSVLGEMVFLVGISQTMHVSQLQVVDIDPATLKHRPLVTYQKRIRYIEEVVERHYHVGEFAPYKEEIISTTTHDYHQYGPEHTTKTFN